MLFAVCQIGECACRYALSGNSTQGFIIAQHSLSRHSRAREGRQASASVPFGLHGRLSSVTGIFFSRRAFDLRHRIHVSHFQGAHYCHRDKTYFKTHTHSEQSCPSTGWRYEDEPLERRGTGKLTGKINLRAL